MPAIPCQSKIDCQPCQDEPILNVSAEAADVDRYLGRFSFLNAIPPIRQYPDFDQDGGGILLQVGCMRWCWSTISQEDADDCARRQAIECAFNPLIPGFPIPDEFHPNRIALYYNQAFAGTYTCPDGNVFTYTIAANQIVALTQGEANAIAFALARLRAKQHRVCISNMDDPICVDTWVTKQITASGPNVAVFPATDRWELVSGTIPPGMTLETGFTSDGIEFSGIPTTIGEYSFRVRVTISTFGSPGFGDFMEKVFTVKIVGIEQSSPLPDASLGSTYSQQLSAAFSSNHELETWSITSGNLPDGLTLSTAGLISGTPTGALAGYSFTVQAQFPVDGTTAVCSKDFSITTVPNSGYWTFDEASGVRADSSGDAELAVVTVTPSVVGLIGNAIQIPTTFPATTWLQTSGNISSLKIGSNGFTLTFWSRRPVFNPGVQRFWPFNARFYDANDVQVGNWLCILMETFPFVLWSDTIVTRFYTFTTNPGSSWRFYAFRYKPTGYVSFSMDANPEEETPLGNFIVIPPAEKASFMVQSENNFLVTPSERIIDEMYYIPRQLSDSELTFMFNSGAGRTWPDVPQ